MPKVGPCEGWRIAQHAQALGQAQGRGGLALAQRRRRDGRHVDVLALRPVRKLLKHIQVDLGLVLAVQVQVVHRQADRLRHLNDGAQLDRLRDLQVTRHGVQSLHFSFLQIC
jgi:hypothetical protein